MEKLLDLGLAGRRHTCCFRWAVTLGGVEVGILGAAVRRGRQCEESLLIYSSARTYTRQPPAQYGR